MSLELKRMGTVQFEELEAVSQPSEAAWWAGLGAGVATGLVILALTS